MNRCPDFRYWAPDKRAAQGGRAKPGALVYYTFIMYTDAIVDVQPAEDATSADVSIAGSVSAIVRPHRSEKRICRLRY
jgi:hypothetical protein